MWVRLLLVRLLSLSKVAILQCNSKDFLVRREAKSLIVRELFASFKRYELDVGLAGSCQSTASHQLISPQPALEDQFYWLTLLPPLFLFSYEVGQNNFSMPFSKAYSDIFFFLKAFLLLLLFEREGMKKGSGNKKLEERRHLLTQPLPRSGFLFDPSKQAAHLCSSSGEWLSIIQIWEHTGSLWCTACSPAWHRRNKRLAGRCYQATALSSATTPPRRPGMHIQGFALWISGLEAECAAWWAAPTTRRLFFLIKTRITFLLTCDLISHCAVFELSISLRGNCPISIMCNIKTWGSSHGMLYCVHASSLIFMAISF